MSTPWAKRKARLGELLQSHGDDDAEGLALDRLLHGQAVIGKTGESFRFLGDEPLIYSPSYYSQNI